MEKKVSVFSGIRANGSPLALILSLVQHLLHQLNFVVNVWAVFAPQDFQGSFGLQFSVMFNQPARGFRKADEGKTQEGKWRGGNQSQYPPAAQISKDKTQQYSQPKEDGFKALQTPTINWMDYFGYVHS